VILFGVGSQSAPIGTPAIGQFGQLFQYVGLKSRVVPFACRFTLKPLRRGPKPVVAQSADADLGQLRRENARLHQRLEHAEAIIGIQKKVAALLGIPMATSEGDETS
jgi:hypothetical protein